MDGCHGVLIHESIILTLTDCIDIFDKNSSKYHVKIGDYDSFRFEKSGVIKLAHKPKALQIKDRKDLNSSIVYNSSLVFITLNETSNINEILEIKQEKPLPEDMENNCKIYGWNVWGDINDTYPEYQMFSTSVQLIDPTACKNAHVDDYCISNTDEKICPKVKIKVENSREITM